jgi:hypothetical protein
LGWCSSACKHPLFPPNITMVIMAKQLNYFSSDQRTCLQKVQSSSQCAVANRSLAFLWRVWSCGFFLAEWPFRLRRYRTRFTVDRDTFVPISSRIFTWSFAVVLGLIRTFRTKVFSSLGDRTSLLPERYDGCVVPWYLYLRTIVCTDERSTYPQAFGNCSQEWTRLLEVYKKKSEVLADFFRFSHDVKQRVTELEGRPWNTSTGTPPLDSNDVCYQKLLKPWHHFLEFSKLFKKAQST